MTTLSGSSTYLGGEHFLLALAALTHPVGEVLHGNGVTSGD
jgi:hypothetical protein